LYVNRSSSIHRTKSCYPQYIPTTQYFMHSDHPIKKFEILQFVYQNALAILLFFAFIKFFFPSIWEVQVTASAGVFIMTLLVVHMVMGFVEFFFHRYVLHMNVIPFCGHFYTQHNLHHGLTDITRDSLYVSNEYPIEEEHQHEASFFPWYTFPLFSLLFTPFFVIAHLLFPTLPIFIAGYSGLLLSIVLYEFIHNMWHMSLPTWQKLFTQKYLGSTWEKMYMFHLRHHANTQCNEGISGFFGIPIADLLFGTYVQANTIFPHKQIVDAREFTPPTPVFLIRWMDTLFIALHKRMHN